MSLTAAFFLQQCINAATVSAFYGLLAVSYVLLHAITRRINLAFGAIAMWSGYMVINLALALMIQMPGAVLVPVALAAALALANTGAVGLLVARWVVRPLVASGTLAMMIATIGLAILLEELMRMLNEGREKWLMPILPDPVPIAAGPGFPVQVPAIQLVVVGLAVALALTLVGFVRHHRWGRIWRACSEDIAMAALCGVPVGRVVVLTIVLATAYAAAAGALIAVYYGAVSFYGGLVIGLKTLFVAVIGGLGSIGGAFLGALCLGAFETFWSAYMGTEYRDVAAFAALAGLMILRPEGLLSREIRRDHA